jgi:hypothetical protein
MRVKPVQARLAAGASFADDNTVAAPWRRDNGLIGWALPRGRDWGRQASHRRLRLIGHEAMSEATLPTRPIPTLRVGVTGHRGNKLGPSTGERLRPQIRMALQRLRSLLDRFSGARPDASGAPRPILRIVSPLAEGADRLVAREGLALGAELLALLPFPRSSYRYDFADAASRAEFDDLIGHAATVIELDGHYDTDKTRKAAYAAVGALVVDESDIVIALWDGQPSGGYGGTAEIVDSARHRGRLVLWLPTDEAMAPRLLLADASIADDPLGALVSRAEGLLTGRERASSAPH